MTLDLRTPEGQSYAENLQRPNANELGPSSRVLVVDTTTALSDHHLWFERLARLPQVTAIVLVTVGTIDPGHRSPVLRTPSALANVGVTLWVGDGPGVPWEGGSQRPGAGRAEADLDDLLTALRFPAVFDRVFAAVATMPHQAANPGLEVDYALVDPAMMRALRLRVLRQLVATGVAARQHDRESTELASVVRGVTDGAPVTVRPGSPLAEAARATEVKVGAAVKAVESLHGLAGLLGGRRAHLVVLGRLADAGEAVAHHHRVIRRALSDMDSSLADGYPAPSELAEQGLPSPTEVNSVELASSLRKALSTELTAGRTLPGLAEQARGLGNRLGSARGLGGSSGEAGAATASWVSDLLSPQPFRLWPTPVMHLLPVVFLTCLLTAWVAGPVWASGVGLVWLGAIGLLFARAPSRLDARLPMAAAAATAVPSVLAGTRFPGLTPGTVLSAVVVVGAVATAVAAAVMAWNRAVTSWPAVAQVRRASAAHREFVGRFDRAIAERWAPADHNRRLADALLVVAGGIDAMASVLTDVIKSRREDDDHAIGGSGAEGLSEVVHHDLVEITMEVLRPSFEDISSRMPLSNDTERALRRAQELIGDYNDHVERVGLRELPLFIVDNGPRRRLAATLWQSSDSPRRIFGLTERSRMTQLCAAGDIRLLQADGAVVVHFASADMDLPATGTTEIVRTPGDAVGALRLTPILHGYVQREVHASAADTTSTSEEGGTT
ncbi:hypothetical protein [Lentzea sp. NPDC055074]